MFRSNVGLPARLDQGAAVDVAKLLKTLGCERYEAAFLENDISADLLPSLTEQDLKDLGVTSVGHRRRMLEAIARLRADGAAVSETPDPGSSSAVVDPRGCWPIIRAGRREAPGQRDVLRSNRLDVSGYAYRSGRPRRVAARLSVTCPDHGWPIWGPHRPLCGRRGADLFRLARGAGGRRRTRCPGWTCSGCRVNEAHIRGEDLEVRVGIATGLVVIGAPIGSGDSRQQTAVGETPNLAARLQSLAGPGNVVIDAATRRQIGGLFDCRELGPRQMKGFANPVLVWTVVGESAVESRFAAFHPNTLAPLIGRDDELSSSCVAGIRPGGRRPDCADLRGSLASASPA